MIVTAKSDKGEKAHCHSAEKNRYGDSALFYGGILFVIVVTLWPIFMVLSEVSGSLTEQMAQVAEAPNLYRANFFVASLIAPAISLLMLTFAFCTAKGKKSLLGRASSVFLVAYALPVSISYGSQYLYVPRLLAAGDFAHAEAWFFLNSASTAYFLNQLGYCSFGVAALLIGYRLFENQGYPRAIGSLLWASGLLSLAAFLGLLMGIEAQGFASIISGLLTLPVGILSILWGKKLRTRPLES